MSSHKQETSEKTAPKMRFTPSQQDAISAHRGNILVSAAAGSGKTAVLTQRVIELLSGDNPVSADKLVIVTFTIASAIEMKQRIEQKLEALLEQHPENQLLQSQRLLLSKAKIGTIHSLCSELIRSHFQLLGLPANYRIAEDNEFKIIKNDLLEEIMEAYYTSAEPGFLALAESLSVKDDSKLLELVMGIYDFIRTFPFPLSYLERFEQMYHTDAPFLETGWGKLILETVKNHLGKADKLLHSVKGFLESSELLSSKYGEAFDNDLHTVKQTQNALHQQDWDRACDIMQSYEKKRLSPVRNFENPALLDQIKEARTSAAELLVNLKNKYFITAQQEFSDDCHILSGHTHALFDIVGTFYQRMELEKRERGILDFADLEHHALRLLVSVDGTECRKTPAAEELCLQYEEIMVDECQDINRIQNLIFWALSQGSKTTQLDSDHMLLDSRNLFLVGDVKQSIYRFRNAVPALFVRRKKLFPSYNQSKEARHPQAKILLQENFRSREQVTNAVNYLFTRLMSQRLGDVAYDEHELLKPAASYLPSDDCQSELHLLDLGSRKKSSEDETETSRNAPPPEAGYIAGLIQSMVNQGYQVQDHGQMRPCHYRDFCILLRSKKGKADAYTESLKARGIPCYADVSNGYFDSFEISVMLDLLRILDNPLLDIPLLAVMLSPMFLFTPDEAAAIRLQGRDVPLYLALTSYARETADQKCLDFIRVLSHLREQAVVLSTDRLIQKIYDQTGFLFVVESMASGDQKSANLRLLLSYAESYESIGYKGLDGFIRFVDKAIERGEDFSCANTVSERSDVVRIMSIHGSKGLEFPICIVADCAKQFNMMDVNKSFLLHESYGFGMKIRIPNLQKEYTNLPLEAIRLAIRAETLSEEMRTLYVALTRAKEKLILVGAVNDAVQTAKKMAQHAWGGDTGTYHLTELNSYLQWVLVGLSDSRAYWQAFLSDDAQMPEQSGYTPISCILAGSAQAPTSEKPQIEFNSLPDPAILTALERSISYSYPYAELTKLPAKVTVTQIAKAKQEESLIREIPPLTFEPDKGLTGAQRGTILHNFMQFADFEKARTDLQGEIERLVTQRFLTQTEADALQIKKIQAFLESELLNQMLSASKLHREYQFLYELDASELEGQLSEQFQQEKVLMQGIADAVIEEDDSISIVDYKTDRLPRKEDFISKYADQLRIYRNALHAYFEKPVKRCIIYSLHLGAEIEV